jgi:hypothetical protein
MVPEDVVWEEHRLYDKSGFPFADEEERVHDIYL